MPRPPDARRGIQFAHMTSFRRARSIMYGNNSKYEYCLWSFAARSILYSNNSEYKYCLWSFAREVRGAEWRKQPKAARQEGSLVRCHFDRARSFMFGNTREYDYCLWSFASEVRGAERRKQPKAARQEGSLVRCHFDHSAEVRGAERRNLLFAEKKDFSTALEMTV